MAQITGSRWGGRSKGLKRVYSFLAGAMALLFLSLVVLGCGAKEAEKLKVATGTSLIADIVQRVGGDKADMVNIVPPTAVIVSAAIFILAASFSPKREVKKEITLSKRH